MGPRSRIGDQQVATGTNKGSGKTTLKTGVNQGQEDRQRSQMTGKGKMASEATNAVVTFIISG